ncbi:MFS transporter [Listeria monocytogenes]|nr:MFS transporter [Listeria monocytogenes]
MSLYIIAIIIIGINLRPAITSVGPLLGNIRDELDLDNWSAGTITSLPLIAFAIFSPIAPKISRTLGDTKAILFGLSLLTVGICIRSIPVTLTLFIGTAIIGSGIAMMNVLLPSIIKKLFPKKVGIMTSVYSSSMSIFAATASGISVPLAQNAGLGWKLSLLFWAGLAVLGILIWIIILKTETPNQKVENINNNSKDSSINIMKSPLAWQVTGFMAMNSFVFYVTISWLPEIMQSFGFSVVTAGWLVSYAQIIGLPATFLAPSIAGKLPNQRIIVLIIGFMMTVGFIGLLISNSLFVVLVSVTLIGFSAGGAVSLSLAFLGMRSRNAQQAGELSGMAQSIGYAFAAIGPLFIGLLFDFTKQWTLPLIVIIIISIIMTISGMGAGRNKYISDDF